MTQQEHKMALPQGTRVQDFEFHRVLGHGGFGITYLGWNLRLDIPVAVKEYLPAELAVRERDRSVAPRASGDEETFQWGLDRFLDEARALARFKHPNIVQSLHYFEAHGTAYIAMEYVEGQTLDERLKRQGTLDEDELKAILLPLLDGLAQVHAVGMLHRDIKPANIMLRDADGSPVLVDFGSARQATGARTRSMTTIVTPGYGPIEQYSTKGSRQGPWTDLYALGGVCYRALTGNAPEAAMERVRNDPQVPAVAAARGKAGVPFLQAIDWALQVNEDDRPQDVAAWRAALLGDEAPAHVASQPPPVADMTTPATKRSTFLLVGDNLALFFFIVALLLLAGGATEGAAVIGLFGVVAAAMGTANPVSTAPVALFNALSESDAATETIQALIARGEDVNARNKHDATPLHQAAENSLNPEIIQALLAAGAHVNSKAEDGATPLHWAAANTENPEIIKALLDGGANVNARDNHAGTPLHQAAESSLNPESIRTLLAAGAHVNSRAEDGATPIHRAATNAKNPEIIKALLDGGANVNARNNHDCTPLHRAAMNIENPETVKALIDGGANVNAMDEHGMTPFDWARALKNWSVAHILEEAGR